MALPPYLKNPNTDVTIFQCYILLCYIKVLSVNYCVNFKTHNPTLTTYFALEIQHCLVTHYYYYLKYNIKILITTIEKIKTTFL